MTVLARACRTDATISRQNHLRPRAAYSRGRSIRLLARACRTDATISRQNRSDRLGRG
jgi:hypothetical protein